MEKEYTLTLEILTPVKDVLKHDEKKKLIKSLNDGLLNAGSKDVELIKDYYQERKAAPALLLLGIVCEVVVTVAAVVQIIRLFQTQFSQSELYMKKGDKKIYLKGYSQEDVVRILKEIQKRFS